MNKYVWVLFFTLLLNGCSIKSSYRFVDWFIVWKVDGYVQWNRVQKKEFDQRIDNLLGWHDSNQLPVYNAFLQQIKSDVEQPLSEEQLIEKIDDIYAYWRQLMKKAAPDITYMLTSLSDSQVEELLLNIDKDIAEDEERFLERTDDEGHKRRTGRLEKLLAQYIGRLTEEQRALINQWSVEKTHTTTSRLAYRKEWRKHLSVALNARFVDDFSHQVDQLFVYPDQWWSDQLRQELADTKSEMAYLFVALQKTLTLKQHNRLSRELDGWMNMFDKYSLVDHGL